MYTAFGEGRVEGSHFEKHSLVNPSPYLGIRGIEVRVVRSVGVAKVRSDGAALGHDQVAVDETWNQLMAIDLSKRLNL
jgi:hypothetical protein